MDNMGLKNDKELIEMLQIKHIPAAVDRKLQEVYQSLPDSAPKKKKIRKAPALITVAAALVIVALAGGVNAVNPEFAESLPIVGSLFKTINAGSNDYINVDTDGLTQHAVPVQSEDENNLSVKSDLYEITVSESYCDGHFMHTALALKTDINMQNTNYMLTVTGKLNGETIGEDGFIYVDWVSTGTGLYAADAKFVIPEEYRENETFEVEYSFNLLESGSYFDYSQGEGSDSVSFTAAADMKGSELFVSSCESEGITIESIYTSPSGIDIKAVVPCESDYGTYGKLYSEDGREIDRFTPGSNHVFSYEEESISHNFEFNAINKVYKKMYLRVFVYSDNEDQNINRISEFEIDLENKSVNISDAMNDKSSPLYYNADYERLYPTIHPTYRASDKDLESVDGYRLEYLSSGGVHKSVYLTFVTPQEYRNLRVELYVNGELRTTNITSQADFISLADYVYDPNDIANMGGELFFIDSGYIERSDELKSKLNIQTIRLGDAFFYMEDEAAIKIYDAETGEKLYEEDVTLTIPEGAEVGEGEMLYKQSSRSSYAIVSSD